MAGLTGESFIQCVDGTYTDGECCTGNREQQAKYEQQHDQGKTLQRGVESELDKKAQAEANKQ